MTTSTIAPGRRTESGSASLDVQVNSAFGSEAMKSRTEKV